MPPRINPSRGFTYVGMVVLVAILGLVAASTIKLGSLLQRRAAEHELLEVGAAFSAALKSYAEASQPGQRRGPQTLEQLLRDPRFPSPRRHLRKLYADPVTGSTEWGIIRGVDKVSIVGVHSLSAARPIKLANFPTGFETFAGSHALRDWKFMLPGTLSMPERDKEDGAPIPAAAQETAGMPAEPVARPEAMPPPPELEPEPKPEPEPAEAPPDAVIMEPPPEAPAEAEPVETVPDPALRAPMIPPPPPPPRKLLNQ